MSRSGQDLAVAVDAKLGDEDAQQRFGLVGIAGGDDSAKLIGDCWEGRLVGSVGFICGQFARECSVLTAQSIYSHVYSVFGVHRRGRALVRSSRPLGWVGAGAEQNLRAISGGRGPFLREHAKRELPSCNSLLHRMLQSRFTRVTL